MSVLSKLTMTATVTPVTGQNTHGDQIFGPPVTGVKCFAFGSKDRLRDERGTEYNRSFNILFLPTATLNNDYLISDVYTHKNQLVLDAGVIVSVEQNHHPKRGLVLQQARVGKR